MAFSDHKWVLFLLFLYYDIQIYDYVSALRKASICTSVSLH